MAARTSRSGRAGGEAQPDPLTYRAPALEKGLDILELLSDQSGGLILSQIAQRLGRSVQEVYRVVLSLERRGYVVRQPLDDTFQISLKLFDLASKHPPLRRLLDAARPILHGVAAEVEEAIMLSVLDGCRARVVAVAENPAPIGFRVRIGTQSRLLTKASGRTLLAYQPPNGTWLRDAAVADIRDQVRDTARLLQRVERIAERGYEMVADETLKGITDVSFPIVDVAGVAQAAITMPFLSWVTDNMQLADAVAALGREAAQLCGQIGGQLPTPVLPIPEADLTP